METFSCYFFNYTFFCDQHHSIPARLNSRSGGLRHSEYRSHLLIIGERDEVHNRRAASCTPAFRDVIHLDLIGLALVSKEEKVCMSRSGEETGNEVLFLSIEIHNTHAATLLTLVFVRVGTLDVTTSSKYQGILFFRHHIFDRKSLNRTFDNLGAAIITILFFKSYKLIFNHFQNFLRRGEKIFKLFYKRLNFFELVFDLLPLKPGQFLQTH